MSFSYLFFVRSLILRFRNSSALAPPSNSTIIVAFRPVSWVEFTILSASSLVMAGTSFGFIDRAMNSTRSLFPRHL